MVPFFDPRKRVLQKRTPVPPTASPPSKFPPTTAPITSATIRRAQTATNRMQPDDVTALQSTMGNQAVARLLGRNSPPPRVQAKLQVGPAGDRYEEEADRIADSVFGSTKQSTGGPSISSPAPLQRASIGPEGGGVDAGLERKLHQSQGSGQALPANIRRTLEPKLGANLSAVKTHTGPEAVQLNQELGAKAFTHRNHIYYGAGQSPADLSLTAHEAVHTIQQGAVPQVQPKVEGDMREEPRIQRFAFTKRGKRKEQIRNEGNWNRMPTSVGVSSGGVRGGAVFVNFEDDSYVLKTSGDESPGRSLFAEHMLKTVGGLETPDSVPLQKGSPTHSSIFTMLDRYEYEHRFDFVQNPQRWQKYKTGVSALRGGQYILVMKNLAKMGGEGFGDAIDANDEEKGDLNARHMLFDNKMLERIGITMAVDFALGNADRFEEMNLDNVFLMSQGNLGAIDNDAILPKLPKQEKIDEDPGTHLERWVARVVRGEKYSPVLKGYAPANSSLNDRSRKDIDQGAPLTRLKNNIGNFDKWFKNFFRYKLELTYNIKFLPETEWDRIREKVRSGLNKGMKRVESSMKGISGMRMKSKFNKYGEKYQLSGMNERNYEWKALQVRQKFMAAMNRGMDADAAEREALKFALSLFGYTLNQD